MTGQRLRHIDSRSLGSCAGGSGLAVCFTWVRVPPCGDCIHRCTPCPTTPWLCTLLMRHAHEHCSCAGQDPDTLRGKMLAR